MFDVKDTLSYVEPKEDDCCLYFCADDLYGYYTFEQMTELLIALSIRLGELRKLYEKDN